MRLLLSIPAFAFCLFAALCPLAAQNTLVVDPSGGTQFTTIGSAIAAAQPGDTVRVLAGRYRENLRTDKGIRLLGEQAELAGGFLSEAMLVENLPSGQTFAMAGFVAGGGVVARVGVRNCDGLVTLTDLDQGLAAELFSVTVLDSRQVSLSRMLLLGASVTSSNVVLERISFDPSILAGLIVNSGRVACNRCTLRGSFSVFGGPGVILNGGDLALTRCSVQGASAGGIPNPAIFTAGGSVLLDPSTTTSTPVSSGPGVVVQWPITSQTAIDANNVLTVDVHGPVGARFGILLTLPDYSVTPFGEAWVQSTQPTFLDLGTIPASRIVQRAFPHPVLPAGLVATMQTVTWDGSALRLGVPSAILTR